MIHALIPAAGLSRRMGTPKLLLPLEGFPVLHWVLKCLRDAKVDSITVVVGPQGAELIPVIESHQAHALSLTHDTVDMRETALAGLDYLENKFQPRSDDGVLLLPADHPTLDAAIVRSLHNALISNKPASIIVPTYAGKRGHPVLFLWKHVSGLRQLASGQGFNAYFRQMNDETLEVPVESESALIDLDTPEDYERIRKKWLATDEHR